MAMHCVFGSLAQARARLAAVDVQFGFPGTAPALRRKGRAPSVVFTESYSVVCVSPSGDEWGFVMTEERYASLPGPSLGLPALTVRTEQWAIVP